MLEVAAIIRLHGAAYLARFADRILPSHRRALRDLEACRTPVLGGHVHQCDRCGREVFSYHSCRNRHCPKCHRDQTERWLTAQRARLLPCAYYLPTFTLLAAAPSASPTSRACVRGGPIERGVHSRDVTPLRPRIQTTARLAPRRLTTRPRSLKIH